MSELLHKELTGAIIGAYYEVFNHTSRTHPEYIYERAMIAELRGRGYGVIQQDEYQIHYKERLVGVQRLDLFVVREVVVENKVAQELTTLHKAQGLSYLKTVDKSVGLLFNFGSQEPEFDRLYLDPARRQLPKEKPLLDESSISPDWLYPELTYDIIGGLYEVHNTLGAGFVHRIYANACYRELQLRGLPVRPLKRMQVAYKGAVIGNVAFGHLIVEDKVMVFPVAITNIAAIHLNDLKSWMRLCKIRFAILANFQATRLKTILVYA